MFPLADYVLRLQSRGLPKLNKPPFNPLSGSKRGTHARYSLKGNPSDLSRCRWPWSSRQSFILILRPKKISWLTSLILVIDKWDIMCCFEKLMKIRVMILLSERYVYYLYLFLNKYIKSELKSANVILTSVILIFSTLIRNYLIQHFFLNYEVDINKLLSDTIQ